MKIKAMLPIVNSDDEDIGTLIKLYETDIVPFPGMFVEEPHWADPNVIEQVICNFEDNHYLVIFTGWVLEELPSKEDLTRLSEQGWSLQA